MKNRTRLLKLVLVLFIGCPAIATLSGCSSDTGSSGPDNNNTHVLSFLVGCNGDGENLLPGLYKMTNTATGPSFELVTTYYPQYLSLDYATMNNGRIAIRVVPALVPAGESGVLFMDVGDIKNQRWAPTPSAPTDYWYAISNERPQVLPDGRIVYSVVLNTDNQYDDAHWGMLAIYNPASGDVELSGNPSGFVLAQPEKGSDTEGGSMNSSTVISPDGKYVYCQVYGYGTDMGSFHIDYKFVVRYEIGKPGEYTRVVQSGARPTAITSDGRYLILDGDGLQRVDLQSNTMAKVDDYANFFNTGQVSKVSSQMFKFWRGSGMGLFDMSETPAWKLTIIDGQKMTGSHRGLGHGAQFSTDESKIYFTASSDYYTNYATDLRIFSTPLVQENTAPDSITTMPKEYCTGFFLLLSE
jgi:hypothetical protein